MGDDYYNPFTAETHIRTLKWWEELLLAAGFVVLVNLTVWLFTIVVFS